ncbi:hypothetical protein KGM_212841 [Danaus plexippus plexippus]|uniref:Uncharacterized protein n=1 Tax=Danaus plexippus plexippus TaxID=278856 RepID=A0A212EGX8_DANPL|nr:hypothetical protein KGM_212841 [Danaus plexippus plexippus]
MLLTGMDGKEYGDTPGAAAPASGYGGPHGCRCDVGSFRQCSCSWWRDTGRFRSLSAHDELAVPKLASGRSADTSLLSPRASRDSLLVSV